MLSAHVCKNAKRVLQPPFDRVRVTCGSARRTAMDIARQRIHTRRVIEITTTCGAPCAKRDLACTRTLGVAKAFVIARLVRCAGDHSDGSESPEPLILHPPFGTYQGHRIWRSCSARRIRDGTHHLCRQRVGGLKFIVAPDSGWPSKGPR